MHAQIHRRKNDWISWWANHFQNKYWLLATIEQQLKDNFYQKKKIKKALEKEINNLENGKTTPFNAAKRLLNI